MNRKKLLKKYLSKIRDLTEELWHTVKETILIWVGWR